MIRTAFYIPLKKELNKSEVEYVLQVLEEALEKRGIPHDAIKATWECA